MTKKYEKLLANALVDAKLLEMRAFLREEDEEHAFSTAFEEKMDSLMRSHRESAKRHKINKKLITILVAAAIILSLAFTVAVFGDGIGDFIIKVTGVDTQFISKNEENPKTIETEYFPSYFPQGFEITEFTSDYSQLRAVLKHEDLEIRFVQTPAHNGGIGINTEGTEYKILDVGELIVYYTEVVGRDYYVFVWEDNGYSFVTSCNAAVGIDEVVKIIESVAEKVQ